MRPTVFGMMDGLVSNFALIAGVAGASATSSQVSLAGLAGLVGGAFSMAAGEYVSVQSQNELTRAELDVERRELAYNAEGELAELTEVFVQRGVDEHARRAGRRAAVPRPGPGAGGPCPRGTRRRPEAAAQSVGGGRVVAAGLQRRRVRAAAPYLFGASSMWISAALAVVGLFTAGAVASRFTSRSWWFAGSRQLALGVFAALVTYGVGSLFHAGVS